MSIMIKKKLAPIVFFVYNRLSHTKKTIEALRKNSLAEYSDLYVYSDAPKNNSDSDNVFKVRGYIKTIDGFKKITVIEREKNLGLAGNIVDGVTETVNKYGKVIVLEDDIVTSPYFLTFMNDALSFYENKKKVWHVSGWNYPINCERFDETFLWRVMNCWGWATWADRWNLYEKDTEKLIFKFNYDDIIRFNLDGYNDFWLQVLKNRSGKINTWAIYWYATIFKNKGFCLNPIQTFVDNIGLDGSGTHCGKQNSNRRALNSNKKLSFEKNNIKENIFIVDKVKEFFSIENNIITSLSFSKKLNSIYKYLDILKQTEEKYILYGAGTGADLILGYMKESIAFLVDKDIKKHNTYKNKLLVKDINHIKKSNLKVIIAVFGREKDIIDFLITKPKIPLNKIITINKI